MRDTETGAKGVIVDVSITAGVRTILCESGEEVKRRPCSFRLADGAPPAALVAKAATGRKSQKKKAPPPPLRKRAAPADAESSEEDDDPFRWGRGCATPTQRQVLITQSGEEAARTASLLM